jgi:glycosyltransferase involved in cell wall biosynthesis
MLRIEKSVTVITPTVGSSKLADAIRSVNNQTYKNIRHLIVVDGEEYWRSACQYVDEMNTGRASFVMTPDNTGANGYYGHRIYAAYPHLINSDYIAFLDEDNWYEPDHIEKLVRTIEEEKVNFAYSFRTIHDREGNYLIDDNCESLGAWPIWPTLGHPKDKQGYLIDTSSFLFETKFLQACCYLWHWGWGGDRRFLHMIKERYQPSYNTSGAYTLCYRLDGNPNSVNKEFFEKGNQAQLEYYKGVLPWSRT